MTLRNKLQELKASNLGSLKEVENEVKATKYRLLHQALKKYQKEWVDTEYEKYVNTRGLGGRACSLIHVRSDCLCHRSTSGLMHASACAMAKLTVRNIPMTACAAIRWMGSSSFIIEARGRADHTNEA
jgi:hypothetical protein